MTQDSFQLSNYKPASEGRRPLLRHDDATVALCWWNRPNWLRVPNMINPRTVAAMSLLAIASASAYSAGDAQRGATLFQACAACHSTKADTHMTGPSLANVWGHKAGTVAGFSRYSEALKHANIVWNGETLDKWLTKPDALVPGTTMTFPGVPERAARDDLVAYLKAVSEGNAPMAAQGRGGMMSGPTRINLKRAPPEGQVVGMTHCGDSYTVKTADGKVNKVWEFNLRLKTDSSDLGPMRGKPVIVGAGMQGDRASVVFAAPSEISSFVKESCAG